MNFADAAYILFFFALGACVGSFLNVVVWRLPRNESLISPPSHCPKCNTKLAWYDNIPIFGWLKLKGRCRYCQESISPRYPLVELTCACLFAFYYIMFFIVQLGPCPVPGLTRAGVMRLSIEDNWPIYALYMFMVAALLAMSLIDAELFIIPAEITWLLAGVGFITHALIDGIRMPGALNVSPPVILMTGGASIGLLCSLGAWYRGWIPTSFPQGEPLLEVDREAVAAEIEEARRQGKPAPPLPPPYTRRQIRAEMGKEMLFLIPPLLGAAIGLYLYITSPVIKLHADQLRAWSWVSGLAGSVLGALVGAFTVWLTRILGTLGFGRVAMGLGDVHLMFGIGAVIGAGAAVMAFFIAPFFGIILAIYLILSGTRREIPYGPYLALATAFVLLAYCDIAEHFRQPLYEMVRLAQQWFAS